MIVQRLVLGLVLLLAAAAPARGRGQGVVTLVEAGRRLFTEETFGGNGRTCATCHPLQRNTQLTLADIAALPDSDPLFVAEFVPALAFRASGPKFEVPVLLRGAGLICENRDGLDDLVNGCSMRSIIQLGGLAHSIQPVPGDVGPGVHALGWGGDGAPGDGSLRSFAAGAVVQHFTKTLARRPGVDFRLPTDAELDALAAFQLSLGRPVELRLPLMFLDPVVMEGQRQFRRRDEENGAVFCENCHFNGGATGVNQGANRMNLTGVEIAEGRPTDVILAAFGLDLTPGISPGLTRFDDGPGTRRFNAPSLIEAADTPPFFHDNSCRTLECAVGHYVAPEFRAENAGPPVRLSAPQVEAIAAFLRALNVLENLRSADAALLAVSSGERGQRAKELLDFARGELTDAQVVLEQGSLHPDAAALLRSVRPEINRGHVGAVRAQIAAVRAQIVVD